MIKDLTVGNSRKALWGFTIPMFGSVIFQQLYNIADSVIAGKFAGEDALAAVGASYPITMIFMAIAVGCNIGCSVVISNLFGAKKFRQLKTAVSTTLLSSIVMSILLTIIGLVCSDWFMRMLATPENILADGDLYLRIYIGGFAFLFFYNVITGIFLALGDSKTPLYFLIGSSLGNIVLDYIFVAIAHWGVAGVAWATFMAQGVSCILVAVVLVSRIKGIRTEGKIVYFSVAMLKRIARIALPSILQQSFISVGNIFIQTLVNGYGSSVIAGYSAAIKLNTFCITSMTTLGNGVSNFTAQNLGARKSERIHGGLRAAYLLAFLIVTPFFIAYFFFGNQMMSIFVNENSTEVIQCGRQFLRIVSPFYYVIGIKLIIDGVLRGAGCMAQFMASTFGDLILRVVLAFVFAHFMGSVGIWSSWTVGWSVAAVLAVIFYMRGDWKHV